MPFDGKQISLISFPTFITTAVQPAPQHSCMTSESLAVVITYSSDWIKFAIPMIHL